MGAVGAGVRALRGGRRLSEVARRMEDLRREAQDVRGGLRGVDDSTRLIGDTEKVVQRTEQAAGSVAQRVGELNRARGIAEDVGRGAREGTEMVGRTIGGFTRVAQTESELGRGVQSFEQEGREGEQVAQRIGGRVAQGASRFVAGLGENLGRGAEGVARGLSDAGQRAADYTSRLSQSANRIRSVSQTARDAGRLRSEARALRSVGDVVERTEQAAGSVADRVGELNRARAIAQSIPRTAGVAEDAVRGAIREGKQVVRGVTQAVRFAGDAGSSAEDAMRGAREMQDVSRFANMARAVGPAVEGAETVTGEVVEEGESEASRAATSATSSGEDVLRGVGEASRDLEQGGSEASRAATAIRSVLNSRLPESAMRDVELAGDQSQEGEGIAQRAAARARQVAQTAQRFGQAGRELASRISQARAPITKSVQMVEQFSRAAEEDSRVFGANIDVAVKAAATGEEAVEAAQDTEKVAQTTEEVEEKAVQSTEQVAEKLGTNVVKGVAEQGAQVALESFAEDAAGTMAEEGEVLGGDAIGEALGQSTAEAGEAAGEGVESTLEAGGEAGGEAAGEAAGEAVGEAVGEAAGEAGGDFAFAGAAEALGGGPEDPVGDVLALGGLIAGAIQSAFHQTPANVETLSGGTLTSELQTLQTAHNSFVKGGNYSQATTLQNVMDNMRTAQTEGRAIYSVKPTTGTGPRQMVMTLSSTAMQNAIASVKADPSSFVGVDPRVLTAMGLNPALTTLAGAQAIAKTAATSNVGSAQGVNTINAYLSPTLSAKNIQDITNSTLATTKATNAKIAAADTADLALIATENAKMAPLLAGYEKTKNAMGIQMLTGLRGVYDNQELKDIAEGKVEIDATAEGITDANVAAATAQLQAQSVVIDKANYVTAQAANINKIANPQTKIYLTYKLNLWKFNNGLSTIKPVTIPIPLTPASRAAVIAYNLQETAVNAKVATEKLAASKGVTSLAEATNALNSKIAASKTINANQQIIINANQIQLQSAQQQLAQNAVRATAYNEYLSTDMEDNQIVSTVNAIEMARATGNPIAGTPGHYGSYNAAQQYAATALKGTTVKPPSGIINGLNIDKNGDPTISTNLMTQYNKILAQNPLPLMNAITSSLQQSTTIKPLPITSVRSSVKLTSPPQKVNYGAPVASAVPANAPVASAVPANAPVAAAPVAATPVAAAPVAAEPTMADLNALTMAPLEARTAANMAK